MRLSVLACVKLLDVLAGGLASALRQTQIVRFLGCDPRHMATN